MITIRFTILILILILIGNSHKGEIKVVIFYIYDFKIKNKISADHFGRLLFWICAQIKINSKP